MRLLVAHGAFALLCACGPRETRSTTPVAEEAPVQTSEEPVKEVRIERSRVLKVSRAQLNRILDGGVGKLLTSMEVRAVVRDGNFAGWEIIDLQNPWIDLVPGDVVTAVNGQPIETPAQVQTLWLGLRGVDAIVVSAQRGGVPFELRFDVQGEGEAQGP